MPIEFDFVRPVMPCGLDHVIVRLTALVMIIITGGEVLGHGGPRKRFGRSVLRDL